MRKTMLSALLSVGLALVLSAPALAHDPDDNYRDARQIGYQYGYRDGFQHGRYDRVQQSSYDMRSEAFERADNGYDQSMGSFYLFQQGYRNGYQSGYDDGFYSRRARFQIFIGPGVGVYRDRDGDGDGDYDRDDSYSSGYQNYDYRTVAYNTGFQDGVNEGARDRSSGHSFRPYEHAAWRDADHNMSTVRSNHRDYKARYREGYEQGYAQGFGSY